MSYPASLDPGPITGMAHVTISRLNSRSILLGSDVNVLKPGEVDVLDRTTLGDPINLSEMPAGEYSVSAALEVYTEVHSKDERNPS